MRGEYWDKMYDLTEGSDEARSCLHELVDRNDLGSLISALEWNYYEHVRSHVDWIEEEAPFERYDELVEFIDESVDGNQWVIYTHRARVVVLVSNNRDAYHDITSEPRDESFVAYFAMRQDIMDELYRRHDDLEETLCE